jgi:hypothetical protein
MASCDVKFEGNQNKTRSTPPRCWKKSRFIRRKNPSGSNSFDTFNEKFKTFLIDVLKMEQTFQMGYSEGEKVLFVLLTIGKVKRSLYQALRVFRYSMD